MDRNRTVAGPVRRIGERVEIHAGVARAGRTPHLLSGDDLVVLLDAPVARLTCQRRAHGLPPSLVLVGDVGEAMVVELRAAAEQRVLYVRPGLLGEVCGRVPGVRFAARADRRIAIVMARRSLGVAMDGVESEDDLAALIAREPAGSWRVHDAPAEADAHPVVSRVRDYLRDHPGRRVSLDELSALARMCRFGVARAFTREIGVPPHAYQTHLRVLRARELIAAGRPLSDVALEVGFVDQSHLTHHFRRLLGVTPGLCARTRRSA